MTAEHFQETHQTSAVIDRRYSCLNGSFTKVSQNILRLQGMNLTLIAPILHPRNQAFANWIFGNINPFLGIGFFRTQEVVKESLLPMWRGNLHFPKCF